MYFMLQQRKMVLLLKSNYYFKIYTKKVSYEFVIKRNITFIRGHSGTGKTSLINLLYEFNRKIGKITGINVETKAKWIVFSEELWKYGKEDFQDTVIFIDENNNFLYTKEFAAYIKNSHNYFVIISRYPYKEYPSLPYSINEIYKMKSSGKYNYIESEYAWVPPVTNKPDIIITEDQNTGFNFFSVIAENIGAECKTANGKNNIYNVLLREFSSEKKILVVADGAALGSEIPVLAEMIKKHPNIQLWLPESFEYLLLSSKMFQSNKYIQDILNNPSEYITTDYFSWERFFTDLLIQETKNYSCHYSKSGELNTCYIENCYCKDKPCHYFIKEDKIDTILGEKAAIFKENKESNSESTQLRTLNFLKKKNN